MWNSSTLMSGSPFCRQAATSAPTLSGGGAFAALGAGIGLLRENRGGSVLSARLRVSRTRSR